MKTVENSITLTIPGKIVELIEAFDASKKSKVRMYKIVEYVLRKQMDTRDFNEYVQVSRNYWQKMVGKNYERCINPLIKLSVLERNNSYSTYSHQCKGYRVNPGLITTQFQLVEIVESSPTEDKKNEDDEEHRKCQYTVNVMRDHVSIDEEVWDWIDEYCHENMIRDRYTTVTSISDTHHIVVNVREKFNGPDSWMSIEKALYKAIRYGRNLINVKNNEYMIMDYDEFLQVKSIQLRYSYMSQVSRFKNNRLYAKRNKTNNRLDSNFTSIPSAMLKFCRFDADRMSAIDLKNSQMVILASLIEQGVFDNYL